MNGPVRTGSLRDPSCPDHGAAPLAGWPLHRRSHSEQALWVVLLWADPSCQVFLTRSKMDAGSATHALGRSFRRHRTHDRALMQWSPGHERKSNLEVRGRRFTSGVRTRVIPGTDLERDRCLTVAGPRRSSPSRVAA